MDCPFCEIVRFGEDLIAYEDDDVVVFPTRDQRAGNYGHMLVVPREHVTNLYDLPDHLLAPLFGTVRRVAIAVESQFEATGTTIRQNNNPPGQDVFHLHVHVIPRHMNDGYRPVAVDRLDEHERVRQARVLAAALGE